MLDMLRISFKMPIDILLTHCACLVAPGAMVLVAMLFLKHSFYLSRAKEWKKKSVFLYILHSVISTCGVWAHFTSSIRNRVSEISAVRNTTFCFGKRQIYFGFPSPSLEKNVDYFCSYLGSFVSLPHVMYFSDTVLSFWMACQLHVQHLFNDIQLGLVNFNRALESVLIWAELLCTDDPTMRLFFTYYA